MAVEMLVLFYVSCFIILFFLSKSLILHFTLLYSCDFPFMLSQFPTLHYKSNIQIYYYTLILYCILFDLSC